jgi:polyphenol oxidase
MPRTLTRRTFAGLIVPVLPALPQACPNMTGGAATPFTPTAGQQVLPRPALSAVVNNPQQLARLRAAYQAMRALPTNDPRSLAAQANMHCFFCGSNAPGDADIHSSWLFFPWHRAYLYFHERILQKLVNDNTFRLPYWDWDIVAGRSVPAGYRQANVSAGQGNSLFDTTRIRNAGAPIPNNFFPTGPANPMNAPNFAAFGGTAGAGGGLENGVHGAIHVWTTTNFPITQANLPRPNMGVIDTAARDPLFYGHHCNIDRLWSEWLRRNPTTHRNPTAAAWRNREFRFFDENSQVRSIRVSQVIDTAVNQVAALGYSYPVGAGISTVPNPTRIDVSFDSASRTIRLPAELAKRLQSPAALNRDLSLVVEGAVVPGRDGVYNIFAGQPTQQGAEGPNFLGIMGVIAAESASAQRRTSLVLNASREFVNRAAAGTQLFIAPAASATGNALVYENVYLSER